MRVALAVDAISPQLTGIGRYCWELATRLAGYSQVSTLQYFIGEVRVAQLTELLEGRYPPPPNFRGVPRPFRRFAAQLRLAQRRRSFDIFHGPNFMLPAWVPAGVITVHDLSVLRFPETHPSARLAAYEREFDSSLRRALHIITPSSSIRDEVIAYTGRGPSEVTAVYNGVDGRFRPRSEPLPDALHQLGLQRGRYALSVSALEPRKRIDRLILAWSKLPRNLRDHFPLVVAGAAGWKNEPVRDQMEKGRAEGWLITPGFVAEQDLPDLYAGAALFLYPSLYEGFGLPPVEAMASGVPTLIAAEASLAEVTAGAAMVTDPEDIDRFVQDITRALEDQDWRSAVISAGIQVAARYSWERCVDETVEVYRRVSERGAA